MLPETEQKTNQIITYSSLIVKSHELLLCERSNMSKPANANEQCVGPNSEQAGKASGCAGCPNQAKCASGENATPEVLGLG